MIPIHSILIANRGEIASRVIKTCRKMGIRSIAVFSDADRDAPFVQEADIAVHIGASNPSESYLNVEKILTVARQIQADAIHPGYGFLSENAAFARTCAEAGLIFIGPNPEAIEAMGSKSKAKALMISHQVPVVPGYQGDDHGVAHLTAVAKEMGFPVLLKATAGGGGKGMRIVHEEQEIGAAIAAAKRESQRAFGDEELIVEKYIASGRHIEFQIFGDKHGNVVHVFERECTLQRRYQKVIEESPSPVMDEELRQNMATAALNAAKALNYDNAGTVEFMYDEESQEFYFLEVNTRLQVEHPVTEEVTGLDLVQMQIESAQGKPLRVSQEDIKSQGYAIECRLYAEDASRDFVPVTGSIHQFDTPEVEGLRVESAIQSGSSISIFYDPMIAKLIVWDQTREGAHRKMQYVLRHMRCQGMTTNQDFLLQLVSHPSFQAGQYDTHFIAKHMDDLGGNSEKGEQVSQAMIAACLYSWQKRSQTRTLLRAVPSGWRNNFKDPQKETYSFKEEDQTLSYRYLDGCFHMEIGEQTYEVKLVSGNSAPMRVEIGGIQKSFHVIQKGADFFVHNEESSHVALQKKDRFPKKEVEKVAGDYEAPMPSQIVKILVQEGQEVHAGTGLMVISSMKMENTIEATEDGQVEEIYAREGSNVEAGYLLLKLRVAE